MASDRDVLIWHCIAGRFNEREAVAYLKANGYDIETRTYWKHRGKLIKNAPREIYEHARSGFIVQHVQRIRTLEWSQSELIRCAISEQDPLKKAMIIEKIASLQWTLAAFYDATRVVMEHSEKEPVPVLTAEPPV